MKVLILYRPHSGHSRLVDEFVRDYSQRHSARDLDLQDVDNREGVALATLYDIVQYPAIIALQADGVAHKVWQGTTLPLMDEVASYAHM